MPGGFRSGRLRKAQASSGGVVEAEARVRVEGSQPIVVPSVPPRATQAALPAATRRNPRRVVLAVQVSFLTRPSMSAPVWSALVQFLSRGARPRARRLSSDVRRAHPVDEVRAVRKPPLRAAPYRRASQARRSSTRKLTFARRPWYFRVRNRSCVRRKLRRAAGGSPLFDELEAPKPRQVQGDHPGHRQHTPRGRLWARWCSAPHRGTLYLQGRSGTGLSQDLSDLRHVSAWLSTSPLR